MHKPGRDKRYLAFVRKQECCVTGEDYWTSPMVAHHVRWGSGAGMGQKPSDYRTIPLTAYEHQLLHAMGESAYYLKHGLDVDVIMEELLRKYERKEK